MFFKSCAFSLVVFIAAIMLSPGVIATPGRVIAESDIEPVYRSAPAREAVRLIRENRFDQAREILLKESEQVSKDSTDHSSFLLAWTCFNSGDWLCVESVTSSLTKRLPQFSDYITLMRASALSGLKNDRAALSLLDEIPPTSPVRNDLLKLKAETLMALGRESEAARIVKTLVDDDNYDSGLIAEITDALLSSEKRDRALAELRNIFHKSSSSGRGGLRGLLKKLGVSSEPSKDEQMDRAWTLLNAHANKDALALAEKLRRAPELSRRCEAREIAARACQKLRRHPDALEHFKAIMSDCSKYRDMPPLLYLGIRTAWRAGDDETAEAWTIRLASEFPKATYNDDIAVLKARTAIDNEQHDKATRILDESLRRWPDGDMANESRWLLAWGAYTSGRYRDAVKRLQDGITASGDDPDWSPRFMYWKARASHKIRKRTEAKELYRQIAIKWPMTFYSFLALNRLAELSRTNPDTILRKLKENAAPSGPDFLRIGDVDGHHPVSRALWLCRAGLENLAVEQVKDASTKEKSSYWMKSLLMNRAGDFTLSHRAAKDLLKETPFWPDDKSAGYYNLAYPRPFDVEVNHASDESKVDPLLLWAVMREESAFISGVESWANATGLMQLIMPTAKSMGKRLKINVTREKLRDPAVNTRLGAAYLALLLNRFDNPIVAIPGYNAGGGAISRWLGQMGHVEADEFVESIPAREARNYARKVFESWTVYSYLYSDRRFSVTDVDFKTKKQSSGGR